MSFFSKTRIKATEMFQDSFDYLSQKYNQTIESFTPASPFGQILTVLANIAEMIFFYIEASITELNIAKARNVESIYGLSRLTGHSPTRGISARGIIGIRLNTSAASEISGNYVELLNGAEIEIAENGLKYFINTNSDILRLQKTDRAFINVELIQGEIESQTFTGTGGALQSYNVSTKESTDHFLVKVKVDGVLYENVNSLYDMLPGARAVKIDTGINGGLSVFFGDENWGMPPALGSIIEVQYVKTRGSSGNIGGKGLTFKFMDPATDKNGNNVDLNEFISINIVRSPNFGSNAEDPDFTRLIAPMSSRSFVLANPNSYIYYLSRYDFFSFIDAYNIKDDGYLDDDNIVYLFLVPNINKKLTSDVDYFSVNETEFLLSNDEKEQVYDILNKSGQQIVTAEVKINQPIIKRYVLNVVIRYFENFDKNSIKTKIRKNLNDYFLNVKRRDRIPRSDLITIVENIEGVDSVNIFFVSEANENAIKNGYYLVPVYGIDPSSNQKILLEEKKIVLQDGEDPNIGLDEFGDIIIGPDELPLIRGGWNDRNDNSYEKIPKNNTLGSLNIFFKEFIVDNLYNRSQQNNMKRIKQSQQTGTNVSRGRGQRAIKPKSLSR